MCYNLFGISFVSHFGFHSGFHSVDDEEIGSEGGEDEGWVGKESHPPNPPVGGILSLSLSLCLCDFVFVTLYLWLCICHHYTSPTASVGSFSAQPALKHKNLMFCPALTSIVSKKLFPLFSGTISHMIIWHPTRYLFMAALKYICGQTNIFFAALKYIWGLLDIYIWSYGWLCQKREEITCTGWF